jgi:hypothetical protein
VGTDSEKQPFFISVVLTDSNNQGAPQYKAILWKKTASLLLLLKLPTKIKESIVHLNIGAH